MAFLVLTHVDAGDHVLIVEQEFRQGLCQFGFSDSRCTHEQEGADRSFLVGKAGPGTADCISDGLDGLILAYDPLVDLGLDAQELFLLAFKHFLYWDSGPLGDNLRNVLGRDSLGDDRVFYCGLAGRKLVNCLLGLCHLAVTQLGDLPVIPGPFGSRSLDLVVLHLLAGLLETGQDVLLVVPPLHEGVAGSEFFGEFLFDLLRLKCRTLTFDGFLLDLKLADVAVELGYRLRDRVHLEPELGSGLVHKVDGLIRKEPVGDVPVGKVDCRDQGIIFDLDPVVVLVFLLQPPHDGDRFGRRGLIDHDHLETALKRLVCLEILLVLVQGRGSDGPEFTPCKGGLQDVRGIHGSGGPTGSNEGVDLIDEQDDLTGAVHNFLNDSLEPLLELALVLRSRNKGSHVQGIYFLALEVLGHVAVDDFLGDAFGDGGLADSGLTYKYRVVLGPPAKDLEDTSYLVIPAYDRIEFALGSLLVQVDGKLRKKLQLTVVIHIIPPFLFYFLNGNVYTDRRFAAPPVAGSGPLPLNVPRVAVVRLWTLPSKRNVRLVW